MFSCVDLRQHRLALLVLALYVGLGFIYSLASPILEPIDEIGHYPYVQHLASGRGLPVLRPGEATLWQQEGGQPPLYYLMAAGLTAWIDSSDLPSLHLRNPHARVGIPLAPYNKHLVIHGETVFPWRGATLAIYIIRWFSLCLGLGTLCCTYALTLTLFPQRTDLAGGVLAINAFLPMFLFLSSSVNNDNLVIFLASLTLLVLVRLFGQAELHYWHLPALGTLLGLAALSKLSGLVLIPLTIFVLFWRRQRLATTAANTAVKQNWVLHGLQDCFWVGLPLLLIAGWWYVRNWFLYGDPTGLNVFLDIVGRRSKTPTLWNLFAEADIVGEWRGFRYSFWGIFGAFNILMRPLWIYRLLDLVTLAVIVGLFFWFWRLHRQRITFPWSLLAVLILWLLLLGIALLRWVSLTLAAQGRLLFPAIGVICLLIALGLSGWLPVRYQAKGAWALAGVLALLALISPFVAIRPAYTQPYHAIVDRLPASAQPQETTIRFPIDYDRQIRLLGYELFQKEVKPGDHLMLTLYWQALNPLSEDYSIYIHVRGLGGDKPLFQEDTYPGGGRYLTRQWQPGQIIRDEHRVPVPADVTGPRPAWIIVGLYRFVSMENLPPRDANGQEVFPLLAGIGVVPPKPNLLPSQALAARFENGISLLGVDLPSPIQAAAEDTLTLTLYWQTNTEAKRDFTVFLHLLDEQGRIVTQRDYIPWATFYPPSMWQSGLIINDEQRLPLPSVLMPGTYRLIAGLYDPQTLRRFACLDEQTNSLTDHVLLTSFLIW
ncbi:MAG: glycosyltransferase family 39 protein [Candidatus Hadarchaeum sp.]